MVSLTTVRASIESLRTTAPGQVYLFVGGTSGIGEHALRQLARLAPKPKVYIVGRSPQKAQSLLDDLRASNPEAEFVFLHRDVSLVRDTDEVCKVLLAEEGRLDGLFLSAGYAPYDGRADTVEGLDAAMTTGFYTRAQFMKTLLPLLNAAPAPRVVAIFAGAKGGRLIETDLGLNKPGNFTLMNFVLGSATMLSLAMARLAAQNPKISFMHAYPSFVWTPALTNGSSGWKKFLLKYVIGPLIWPFGLSAAEAGDRALDYVVSEKYAVKEERKGELYLLNWNGEIEKPPKLLVEYEKREIGEKVWEHLEEVLDVALNATS
ncbi:hypothetical protein AJ80_09543 [Polytolypa hystricis UAMH7299]|uniref:Ketoreductase (KR) domain-containing protein n=1 Tax=Polytolypa hystricis (strain UAMH7299) TaxID=1447883 RepID=A0A2B7WGD5_POLH7|nr:hypothetical protein AJ80_09543 [Polytolypa hystricis UAMH7299]